MDPSASTATKVEVYCASTCSGQTTEDMSSYMSTDLYRAAEDGRIEPFRQFTGPLDGLVTPIKDTILHLHLASSSPSHRSVAFFSQIIQVCRPILLLINDHGDTLLHIAARYGHFDIAKLLIQCKKDEHQDLESGSEAVRQMLWRKNTKGETALHETARNDHPELVELLLDDDPQLTHSSNNCGETPLYLASERGHREVVRKMLMTCSSSAAFAGPNGKTALHAATMHRHGGIVRAILEKERSLANKADDKGWTPLHYAAYVEASGVVKQLLEYDKYAAYTSDSERKRTALHLAACQANIKSIRAIIKKCPDCCKLVDDRGWNVAHYAVISKSHNALKIVLESSACIYLVNEKGQLGNTPLHLLAASPFIVSFLGQRGRRFDVHKQNVLSIRNLLYQSPCHKKEILKWMSDLGNGPLGQILIKRDDVVAVFERARDFHIVVAALVATVAFAAAFTLPGGYASNDDKHRSAGTAILSKSSAFQAFVIADATAILFSTASLFIHFTLAFVGYQQTPLWLIKLPSEYTIYAMFAMVAAFITGSGAVLPPSSGLTIATGFIGLSFYAIVPLRYVFYLLT